MGATVETVQDLLPESPRAVIVGVNPAPTSVQAGHYYQGQLGQRLWQRLTRSGLLSIAADQSEDDAMPGPYEARGRVDQALADLAERIGK
jgi:TDG/mug DNA glycosylase family protein